MVIVDVVISYICPCITILTLMPVLFVVEAPTEVKIVITLLTALRAADRAFGRRLAGGRTVAASLLNSGAPIALAGAAVGAVAVGCPLAPVVAQLVVVFQTAFCAGVSRGAGARFAAAGVPTVLGVQITEGFFFSAI